MSILKEFREFAVRGNVVDMAVGIIIGAAFGKIVSSLVADVLTPPLGVIIGGVNFSGLKLVLKAAAEGSPEVAINYGAFIQQVVDFIIVAWAIFWLVKAINTLRKRLDRETEAAPPPAPPQEKLLMEIRDILKAKT
jgi:large conductance mechanosensitive channel